MKMIKQLAKSVREYKRPSLITLFLMIGEAVIECAIPYITATFLINYLSEAAQTGAQIEVWYVVRIGLILALMAMCSLACGGFAGFTCAKASSGFAKNLRHDLFHKVQSFTFTNIDHFSSSSLVTRLTTDVNNVQMAYMMLIRIAIRCPLMLIFSVVMAAYMGGLLAVTFAVVIPVLGVGLFLIGKQYEAERAEHGCTRDDVQRTNGQFSRSSQTGNSGESIKTCERIAKENGVSKNTVLRASKYMKGVEIAEELIPGLKQSILSGQTKVSKADMHRLAKAAYHDRAQTLQDILHPELKVEPKPDADGVIRVPGKAPVMPFRKFESIYDSDAYPEDVRYEYVALEELTTRFRISFNYQLEQMPDNAQRDVILEIIQKHKDYLASLEAALADDKEQTA